MASPGEVEIRLEQLPGGEGLARIRGELDLATVSELERIVDDASATDLLIVDLTDCTFLDSSAVRVLLETAAKIERAGGGMAVIAPDGGIRRVLEISGVDTVLPIHATLGEAV